MDVQSAFSAGSQGLRQASAGMTEATVNLNRDIVNQQQQRNQESQSSKQIQQQLATPAIPSQVDSLVQLTTNQLQAEANVRSIQTADDVLGTLIDVKV